MVSLILKTYTFYLTEINSPNANITEIEREYHKFDTTNQLFRGIPFVDNFKHHKIIQNDTEIIIDAYGQKNYIKYDTYSNGGLIDEHNLWTDSTDFQIWPKSPRTYLFTNENKELTTTYDINVPSYRGMGEVHQYYIKHLTKSSGERIEFNYYVKDLQAWRGYSHKDRLQMVLLESIIYPDRLETFVYDQNGTDFKPDDNNDKLKVYDVNLFNQVKSKITSEKVDTGYVEMISESYEYVASPNKDSIVNTKVTIRDKQTNDSTTQLRKYRLTEENPIFENELQPYMNPSFSTLELIEQTSKNKDKSIKTEFKYDNFADSSGNKFNSKYQRFLTESTKQLIYDDFQPIVEKKKYFYEFETITNFDGTDTLKNSLGRVPSKITTESYKPNITNSDELLYKSETEYLNLPFLVLPTMRIDTVWNIEESTKQTIFKQFFQKEQKTVTVFDTILNYGPVFVSPQLYLTKKETYFDENETVIGGIINNYEEQYYVPINLQDRPSIQRGSLISDSIFGKDFSEVRLLNKYGYKEGWYKSFLNNITNDEGTTSKLYYNYNEFDSELTGTYHLNNNLVSFGSLFREYHQYESPLVTENYIRKYNSSGQLDTTILRNVVEYTQFGKIGRMIDPNGKMYQTHYDKLNRTSYVWHPYDYPPGEGEGDNFDGPYTFEFDCNMLINIYTEVKRRLDSLDRRKRIFPHSDVSNTQLLTRLVTGTKYSLTTPIDSTNLNSQNPDVQVIRTEEYISNFTYKADSTDLIKNQSLDSLRFVFVVAGGEINNFVHLTLSNDRFDFERKIIIGAEMLGLDVNAPIPNNSYSPARQRLTVDVTPIIDSIQSMAQGEEINFQLKSSSERGWIELLKPCLEAKKSDTTQNQGVFRDYTYHFTYDTNNKVNVFSKIDDQFHTYNSGWEETWSDRDGRYKRMDMYKGMFYRNKKSEVFIGHPDSPDRLDAFVTNYSGFGQPIKMYDAYNNVTEFEKENNYDFSTLTFPDNNTNTRLVTIGHPYEIVPNYDSTDQDFMGLAKRVTNTDEKGLKTMSYFDMYGKLRLTILDSVNTFLTTKYNYDNLGRMKNVVHENGDTTMYWYDDYGRIKYKYKTEMGYVSYSYDKQGRLRFTQNSMQAANQKLNYYQYDDLGRITLLGEASIDETTFDSSLAEPLYNSYEDVTFERLTDNLDPNRLYYEDFGVNDAGILTLNSTMFDGTLSYTASSLDTFSIFNGYNLFDSDTSYPSPYINHRQAHGLNSTSLADYNEFEDIGINPNFVRKAVYYDEYPVNTGNIWGAIPPKTTVDSIAGHTASNSKGRPTAIAYRDIDGENLHYSTFAYDARGRITKIIRYNEYLGYDGVFYEYNSSNQIIKEISADPLTQMVTWYSYDQSGRMDSIWVSLDSVGTGFGVESLKYLSNLDKSNGADLAFKYDRNGRTDTIIYNKIDLIQSINYSNRGWVDSLVVNRNSDEVLKIAFGRDINGLIEQQNTSYWTKDTTKVHYDYDNYYRLESFAVLVDGATANIESYDYDKMGNRTKKISNGVTTNYTYGSGVNTNKLNSFKNAAATIETQYEYNEIGGVSSVNEYNTLNSTTEVKEQFDYLSNGLVKSYTEMVDAVYESGICTILDTYTEGVNNWMYRYNENGQLESKRLFTSDSGDFCGTNSWVYYKIGAYGDVKTVYHGRQTSVGPRNITFYPDRYLTANGLVEILPDGTKEYNILDNKSSTRIKVREGDTTLVYSDYEPYGEGQMNSSEDIPKRGYMGTHRSKENGYTAMGARLYNSETGRFMSVDPLAELFTGHSPYSYSFNNPVMFSDPSGLAPEKENRTMAPSYGGLGASISGGYWNEISTKVLSGKVAIGLDNPLAPAQRRNVYGTDISYEWMESAAIGGGSGGGGGSSGGGNSSSGKSSRRGNNEGNLNRKSHQEKTSISKDYLNNLKPLAINFYSENEFNDFNQMFNNMFESINDNFISTTQLNNFRRNVNEEGVALIDQFRALIIMAYQQGMNILFISTNSPMEMENDGENYSESESKSFSEKGDFNGIFRKFGKTFIINYDANLDFFGRIHMIIHENAHMFESINGKSGHSNYFYKWFIKTRDLFWDFFK